MLEAMRQVALDFLVSELAGSNMPNDPEKWFAMLRAQEGERLFPFLVEKGDKIERVYILRPDEKEEDLVRMEVRDVGEEIQRYLPFKQYRVKAIGPVIKRTAKGKGEFGPEPTTQRLTLDYFEELSMSESPWKNYFSDIVSILGRSRLDILGTKIITTGKGKEYSNLYSAAISLIPETKGTVFLTVTDNKGRLPGQRKEYLEYLESELASLKYSIQSNPSSIVTGKTCPLCGKEDTTLYANAVKGAGFNIGNADRDGAFPGVSSATVWKAFALCIDCADLLYLYKFHISERFLCNIAGQRALLLPYTGMNSALRLRFMKRVAEYVRGVGEGVARLEDRLLRILSEEPAVTTLTILWATFGQNIEDVKGVIIDVLPSRLGELSRYNDTAATWRHPVFPEKQPVQLDLGMNFLLPLFRRPGAKKAKQVNASSALFHFKRDLMAAIYKGTQIDEVRLKRELLITARWYLAAVVDIDAIAGKSWFLWDEAESKEGKGFTLTLCGWMKNMAFLLHYLRRLEVLPMPKNSYQPEGESLKPFLGPESGIDTKAKAYAFILGALYGKLMQVQAARGVNVSANALTWLKRLSLSGKDLPELYVKVREKLLAYGTEGSEDVRALVEELGMLAATIGNNISLDETDTCYFLLLGQSLSKKILPTKSESKRKE